MEVDLILQAGLQMDLVQTRVLVIGRLTPELERAYEACLAVQDAVVSQVRAGQACSDLYDIAVTTAAHRGSADSFMGARPDQVSFVGHGLGLEMDEPPHVARSSRWVLQAGNVIAIEPKIVFPGVGAVSCPG